MESQQCKQNYIQSFHLNHEGVGEGSDQDVCKCCKHISRTLISSKPKSLVVIKRVEIQLTITDCGSRCHLCASVFDGD